jgi:glycerophosphoryl diester phosphodiesterase
MERPWVIGHRGASGHAPENTMAAFRRAAELGARFIETDLHLTRDFRLVAIHDSTLERTTNGRGAVRDYTLAELLELDAGSWFGAEFAGQRIPTLEEIFHFAHEADMVFYLEIKSEPAWGLHHALVGALQRPEDAARSVVISFDSVNLDKIRRLDATLITGLLFDQAIPDVVEQAQRVGARQLAPRGDLLTPELVELAHRADLQVVTWTVNHPDQMRAAIRAGVDGIMTDYPDRLVAILKEQRLSRG